MQRHFPGKKSEEYRRMLGSFGVSGDLALQQVIKMVNPVASLNMPFRKAFGYISCNLHFLLLFEYVSLTNWMEICIGHFLLLNKNLTYISSICFLLLLDCVFVKPLAN